MTRYLLPIIALLLVIPGCFFLPEEETNPPIVNEVPTAYIDSITPTDPTAGDKIMFQGHGTDPTGTVVGYKWRSNVAGDIGSTATFDTKLNAGDHTIYLKVQDNNGAWSNEVRTSITVLPAAPANPPPINSFTAAPANILTGGSSTLSWNVSDATSVTIDQGIGTVSTSGTKVVSPATSTHYILTATNANGSNSKLASISVGLIPLPPSGSLPSFIFKSDLTITNITKVEAPSGNKIQYTIKNEGLVDAAATTCKLYANGYLKASDSVPALAGGATATRQFDGWIYNPQTPIIRVVADATGTLNESDETNNVKQVTMAVETVYNFVSKAAGAMWQSGNPTANLSFGGAVDDNKGFACYRTNITLEDNNSYAQVLETHPKWIDNGWISGLFYDLGITLHYKPKPGDYFTTKVGLIKGANSGNARFVVWVRPQGGTNTKIISYIKTYNGHVDTLTVSLNAFAGKECDMVFSVEANGPSTQDWAVWPDARIVR